jgi:hypothetical protein
LSLDQPPGINVIVEPQALTLGTGESAEFSLQLDPAGAPYDYWQFGNLHWSDDTHAGNVPIAAQPVYLRSPEEISLSGTSGQGTLPVDFGYDGTYFSAVHGLHEPGLQETGIVEDDVTNNFSFRFDNGVRGHFFTLQPGELFLRIALFDELTDGEDDLDVYLYYCPTPNSCTEVGKSGGFTSEEEIDLILPPPGFYTVLVHGFETDQLSGGPGANYELFAWSFGPDDDRGNLEIETPDAVASGDRLELPYQWSSLDAGTRYLGAISHDTPFDLFFLTIVTANLP